MILTLFGDLTRHRWLLDLPKSIWITYYDDIAGDDLKKKGHLHWDGCKAFDLNVLVPYAFGLVPDREKGESVGSMPVWDFDPSTYQGDVLSEAERAGLSPELPKRIGQWLREKPLALVIDDVRDWWNTVCLGNLDPDPDVQIARRERRAAEALYNLSRKRPIILLAGEEPQWQDGEIVGVKPAVPRIIERVSVATIHVVHDKATLFSTRRSEPEAGTVMQPSEVLSVFLGLPSTPEDMQ